MATFRTQQTLGRGPIGGVGGASQLLTRYASYSLTAALAAADVVEMIRVPAGAIIYSVLLKVTDLDTNGTPTITLTVGDGADTDRLVTSSTIGQAGGSTTTLASTGLLYTYTAEDTIDITVGTGPATGATTGTLELVVQYFVNPMVS